MLDDGDEKSASSASVSVLSVRNENRSTVRRVAVDPSFFSPSLSFCFFSAASPNNATFIELSLLEARERVTQVSSLHYIRSAARRIIGVASFLLASLNASFFSPLYPFCFLSAATPNNATFIEPFLLVAREKVTPR
jgi:hypothetical protein